MPRLLSIGFFVILAGCASNPYPRLYANVDDERGFWTKSLDLVEGAKQDRQYRACIVDSLMSIRPEPLRKAIDQFLVTKALPELEALERELKVFKNVEPIRVGQGRAKCDTAYVSPRFSRFEKATSRRDYMIVLAEIGGERDGVKTGEVPDRYLQCLITKAMAKIDEEHWAPIDRFLSTHKREDFDRILRAAEASEKFVTASEIRKEAAACVN